MKKVILSLVALYTGISFASTSDMEAKLQKLYSMHGAECAPQEIGIAEAYLDTLKGLPEKTEDGKIRVVDISDTDYLVFKNKVEIALAKAEKKIFSDVDNDGVPCYEEIEKGTNPNFPENKKVAKAEEKPKPKVEEKPKPKKRDYEPLLTQARIHFEYDKAEIKKEYMPYLNVIAKYLKANKDLKVKIVGYTDDKGSKKYNDKLALQRAKAVKEALVKFGVDAKRIEIVGKGKEGYLFDNKSKLNRFTNRRVDFFILKTN